MVSERVAIIRDDKLLSAVSRYIVVPVLLAAFGRHDIYAPLLIS